ncbi:helix-turn-helix domain-containing protein [Flavobacterium artemisiae]|uniref:Helix-turn-helix domain-containing protein n=1 Tax=Flavobacterium artemisiae TaxID=2126556 RepID=A0ABW4HGV8_9FLAO
MKKVTHYYSLTPEWQNDLAAQFNTPLIDNRLINIPKDIGKGFCYFTQIMTGISAVYIDLTATEPLKITRLKSNNQLYIFHFDLSEHINLIKINNIDYQIGSFNQLDLAIIDNELESTFKPAVNERTVALRILLDKNLLRDFIQKLSVKEDQFEKEKNSKKAMYHYGNIDSNSILLIQSLKNKSIDEITFDSFLKGVCLKVLGNFFNKFHESSSKESSHIIEIESKAIERTKDYLINNLHGSFPSIVFLAGMAGMSSTKYKTLFKAKYNDTPKNLFIKEKILLAQKLLKSGKYETITQVIYELNYNKLSFFSVKYRQYLNSSISNDFVKTPNSKKSHLETNENEIKLKSEKKIRRKTKS